MMRSNMGCLPLQHQQRSGVLGGPLAEEEGGPWLPEHREPLPYAGRFQGPVAFGNAAAATACRILPVHKLVDSARATPDVESEVAEAYLRSLDPRVPEAASPFSEEEDLDVARATLGLSQRWAAGAGAHAAATPLRNPPALSPASFHPAGKGSGVDHWSRTGARPRTPAPPPGASGAATPNSWPLIAAAASSRPQLTTPAGGGGLAATPTPLGGRGGDFSATLPTAAAAWTVSCASPPRSGGGGGRRFVATSRR